MARGFGSNGYVSSSTQPGPALNIQQGANGFHNNNGVSYNNISHHQQQQQGHGGFVNNMARMQQPAQSRNIIKERVSIFASHLMFRLLRDAGDAAPGEPLQPAAALARLPGLC